MPAKKLSQKSDDVNSGCGCSNIPISLILVMMGAGYWGFTHFNLGRFLPSGQPATSVSTPAASQPTIANSPSLRPAPIPSPIKPSVKPAPSQSPAPLPSASAKPSPAASPTIQPQAKPSAVVSQKSAQTPWERKAIRGIYLSRYQVTNNATEQTIRDRVRYYRSQGINTIIHGVWGNGCTMYHSAVMQQTFGYKSCPNQFQEQWLNWLIDEAHKQGMQVHAYFEKGIKIDENSPIFDLAIAKRWIVPGVDKTYAGIDHYVLDVEIPEVSNLFRNVSIEFVKKYPAIDAVQWDDYLGYHAELPGKVDRTAQLTKFVRQMRAEIKRANPRVKFDLCHHNPYWGKRYFAADWQNWSVDRVFIQTYNDANFAQELEYAKKYAGVAISDKQLNRLKELVNNDQIKSILVFPSSGKPEEAAALVKKIIR